MALSLTRLVTIVYITLNAIITLIVSILGTKYVRDEIKGKKEAANSVPDGIVVVTENESKLDAGIPNFTKTSTLTPITPSNDVMEELKKEFSKKGLIKVWLKLVWKMRSCYLSLVVHLFDILTDILVIIEWWDLEANREDDEDVDGVDSRLMSQCAIIVMIFHRLLSTLAIWMKESSIYRSMLQFVDILIFEELLVSHRKIVSEFRGHRDPKKATETTTTFKYIRSLEAVLESIPQSVLQMVFLIRTGGDYEKNSALLVISIFSIAQSIISMTNSILKQDNLFMDYPAFKRHCRRLPPTVPFFKHALCRFSEIFYRIALLSLFWAVCGGEMFAGLMAAELLTVIILTLSERRSNDTDLNELNADEVLLRFQCLVVLPTEMVFAEKGEHEMVNCQFKDDEEGCRKYESVFLGCCWTVFFCYIPMAILSTWCCTMGIDRHYLHPRMRLGGSLMEWTVLVISVLLMEDAGVLFATPHYLTIFIIGFILFVVNTQYLFLLPEFQLPHGVGIRTKWGYAFNGELDELKRIRGDGIDWDQNVGQNDKKDIRGMTGTTPAMYAMANGNLYVAKWLIEEKGATKHETLRNECIVFSSNFNVMYQRVKARHKELKDIYNKAVRDHEVAKMRLEKMNSEFREKGDPTQWTKEELKRAQMERYELSEAERRTAKERNEAQTISEQPINRRWVDETNTNDLHQIAAWIEAESPTHERLENFVKRIDQSSFHGDYASLAKIFIDEDGDLFKSR